MTTEPMTAWQRRVEQVKTFITVLHDLDTGGRARLKRNAGRSLADARDIHRVFYQALPYDVSQWQQEDYFLIATLFPLVEHNPGTGDLGDTLRQVRRLRSSVSEGQQNSLDRRFQTLLDSDREQFPFRLRQAVRLAATHRESVTLNWERLLLDTLQWEHPNHAVQLRWARHYFVGPDRPSDADTDMPTEPQGEQE